MEDKKERHKRKIMDMIEKLKNKNLSEEEFKKTINYSVIKFLEETLEKGDF